MIKVLKPGFFTTVQDSGRLGYRDKGVPVSGVMDAISAKRINTLLENEPDDALLEITMTGPTLQFEMDTFICIGGALFSATVNDHPIENFEVHKINKGDVLSYGRLLKGFRGYLGIKGGIKTHKVLGSQSFYHPITDQASLIEHIEVDYDSFPDFNPKISRAKMDTVLEQQQLQVEKGPEYGLLSAEQSARLFSAEFTIAKENNRMAYQISEQIEGHSLNILTSFTQPGTVQLTPSGRIIILMRDGQTTGGYPRILQLSEKSICALAQKKMGDTISFEFM